MSKDIIKESSSALFAKRIYIEKMLFARTEINGDSIIFSNSDIGKSVSVIEEDVYKVSITLKMSTEDASCYLELIVTGIFELKDEIGDQFKDVIINKNTMAILFPYLRSQVTLLTAQPDMKPVVLPAININSLFDKMNDNEE